ncbi:hypothetical protein CDD82_2397 [Ophiocordyceps australis]|uniref:Prp 4 CRoW domain-containing protein n=1 Tax=Ophiocordyceps australis TaxID=1399860 RepID=A0A2C5ZHU0_9HYPO|nr:hypothetical protein CDD82_2397 [Ophiocordyceps australis]
MPLPGLSLARRDTNGYKPETKDCSSGNTCEEACGAGFDQCVAKDDRAHCYNKAKGDKCCMDGSGNSCEAGYYCTSDPKAQNWCCPMDLDLAACASAYHVNGGLQMAGSSAASTGSPIASSATKAPPSSSAPSAKPTSSEAVPLKEASKAPESKPTEMPSSSGVSVPVTTAETQDESPSDSPSASSSETAPAATAPSSTVAGVESLPSVPVVPGNSTRGPQPPNITVSTAASTGISALLLVAAGMFALL